MKQEIDACGLPCPEPVLKTREVIMREAPQTIEVLVDNPAARENVTRFLSSQNYTVADSATGDIFRLIGEKTGEEPEAATQTTTKTESHAVKKIPAGEEKQDIVVLIMSDTAGSGDEELGRKLLINYIKTLKELGDNLRRLIFVNGGVRMTCATSPVIEELREYEANGTIILSCGTCMEHFGLTGEKGVGGLTNMLDIVLAQQNADKVITLG